jgi:hypothetical protein
MPVFLRDDISVLYVHVPKTAGSSIAAFFQKNDFQVHHQDLGGARSLNRYRRCSPQHMHAEQILSHFRMERFDCIFMTVRNPMDRLLSEYKMRAGNLPDVPPLPIWFDRVMKRYLEDRYCLDNHIRPQVEFLVPSCKVFRQEEDLGPEFTQFLEERLKLTLSHRILAVTNRGREIEFDPADVAKIAPAVHQFYRQDYLTFGY